MFMSDVRGTSDSNREVVSFTFQFAEVILELFLCRPSLESDQNQGISQPDTATVSEQIWGFLP